MIHALVGAGGPAPWRPWLTYGVLAACAAVFLAVQFAGGHRLAPALRSLEDARRYHEARPYLVLDPRLGGPARSPAEEPARPGPNGTQAKFSALEQAELDGLVRSGFDVLAATPQWRLGVVPAELSPLSFATHLLFHAGFLPLLLNLVLLHLTMPFLEEEWGPGFLAVFGLTAAAAGAGVFALRHPGLHVALVGASGLAAAVAGALLVLRGGRELRFSYWLGSAGAGTFEVPCWAILPAWALKEAVGLLSPDLVGPATASRAAPLWAHGAALAMGALGAAALRWGPQERRRLACAPSLGRSPPFPASRGNAARSGALSPFAGRESAPLDGSEAVAARWDAALEAGRAGEVAPQVVQELRRCLERGETEKAHRFWQELRQYDAEIRISLPTEVRLAEALAALGLPADSAQVAESAARDLRPDVSPLVIARLARVAAGTARERLVALALSHPELPETARAQLGGAPSEDRPPSPATAFERLGQAEPPGARESVSPRPAAARGEAETFRAIPALPLSLADGVLRLEVSGAVHALTLSRVRAVSAAAVDDAAEANLVLDLFLEAPAGGKRPGKALRLETHRFDPRVLVPAESEPEDAFLSVAGAVLAASSAAWLLGDGAHHLRRYPSLEAYERDLLRALRLGPA